MQQTINEIDTRSETFHEVWGQTPQHPEVIGVWGKEAQLSAFFTLF